MQNIINLYKVSDRYLNYLQQFDSRVSLHNSTEGGTYGMSINEIRKLTGTEKHHLAFRDFDKNILKAATEDINQAGVEILVKYEKVKRGRKITHINFYVRARNSFRDTEFDVINVRPDQIREFLK